MVTEQRAHCVVAERDLLGPIGGDAAEERAGHDCRVEETCRACHDPKTRRAAATRLRREIGIEAARVVLRRTLVSTTELNAGVDRLKVIIAMCKLG